MTSQPAIYKQVHPCTGITQCVEAFFTCPIRKSASGESAPPDLIVARSNLLQIYSVRLGLAAGAPAAKLDLLGEWTLWGIVESLSALRGRFAGIQSDAILLTFREAKMVVLAWDDDTQSIKPSSLHYFEDDLELSGGHCAFSHGPRAISDPQGRCAAVVMMGRQVALLPAMDPEVLEARLPRSHPAATAQTRTLPTTLGNACVLDLAKLGVRRVRDAAFLHRYNEPVLLLLHEAGADWVGRARRGRKDGMALVALSVNIAAKRYPRLWAVDKLPADAMQLVPVRSGGALVLCQHLILFYTQGASCSLAVSAKAYAGINPVMLDFAEHAEAPSTSARRHAEKYATNMHPEAAPAAATGAPRAEGFDLDLAGTASVWLSNAALLLSLASGDLLMLMLQQEGSVVRRLKVVGTGINTSPATALCRPGAQLLFLGSFSGDSFLVHTNAEEGAKPAAPQIVPAQDTEQRDPVESEPAPEAKRQRMAASSLDAEDLEVSLIYHTSFTSDTLAASVGSQASKFKFKVADMLPSIGPVRDLAVASLAGSNPANSKGTGEARHHPLLLAAVGSGKQGSLAVLRCSVVPHVITHVPLQGVQGVWAVRYWPQGLDWEPAFEQHAYLLIAEEHSTRILQAGGGDDDEEGGGGQLGQLEGPDLGFDTRRKTLAAGTLLNDSRIVQVCAEGFKVLAGTTCLQEVAVEALAPGSAGPSGAPTSLASASFCDPYLLLRLSSGHAVLLCANPDTGEVGFVEEAPLALHGAETQDAVPRGATSVLVCRANGVMEVFELPLMARVWAADDVTDLPQTLVPRDEVSSAVSGLLSRPVTAASPVVEVRLECFASSEGPAPSTGCCNPPLLFLRLSDHSLVVYRAFHRHSPGIKFAKLPLNLPLLRSRAPGMVLHRFDGLASGEADPTRSKTYCGMFVSGLQPVWLIVSRGGLIMHPMDCDGAVVGFSPFHNPNCSHGFIALSATGALRICQLPTKTRLDTAWPLQKHNQGATVQQVAFHQPSQLCVLLVSQEGPSRPHLPEEDGGNPQASYAYAAASAAAKHRGTERSAEVRLVQPGTWQTVWRQLLEAGELPLSLHSAALRVCGEQGQLLPSAETEPLVAVGTALGYGEDHPCIGRVLVFRVKPAPQDAAQGLAFPSGELAYSRLVQGPVNGLAVVEGTLVVAYGTRIDLYAWTGARLQRVAFHEGIVEVTCLATIKSFLMYGDALKGLSFLATQQGSRQLVPVSKDYSKVDVSAAGTVVAGGKLGMVCSDAVGTLRMFAYATAHPQMWRGKRLLPLGTLHTGHFIGSLVSGLRLASRSGKGLSKGTVMQAALGGTSGGALVALAPVEDDASRTALQALQQALVKGQVHSCGLNPKAFRRRHQKVPSDLGGGSLVGIPWKEQNMLDGDLLWSYASLSCSRQLALAASAGSTRETLLGALHDLACALLFI
ncbi:hypothetical protein WJX73_000021 [Symbiochloris irregularis]|uniref:Cleavage and polyadenylation specificity factor subunit 1 n=1 Tax=Symbiochloris irregularis TaxID=706552 RepID=A0AAW1P0V0_9CHLO